MAQQDPLLCHAAVCELLNLQKRCAQVKTLCTLILPEYFRLKYVLVVSWQIFEAWKVETMTSYHQIT